MSSERKIAFGICKTMEEATKSAAIHAEDPLATLDTVFEFRAHTGDRTVQGLLREMYQLKADRFSWRFRPVQPARIIPITPKEMLESLERQMKERDSRK